MLMTQLHSQKGDYIFLFNLNISRSINIIATGVVNIIGDGKSNLFNINASDVLIKGLNIDKYNKTAIYSIKGNLTIENNKIDNTYKE